MIQLSSHKLRRNHSISNSKFSPTELANHRANRNELGERCRIVFEKLRPQLIKDYENWLIAIEPQTEQYLIASELDELIQKIKQYYPDNEVKLTIFKLNQVGSCGKL